MKALFSRTTSALRGLWHRQDGATAILFAIMVSGLIGMVGLSIDVGRVMTAKNGFTASAQSAALAGAYALLQSGATQTTVAAAVTAWNTAHAPSNVTVTSATTSLSCVTTNSNLPNCTTSQSERRQRHADRHGHDAFPQGLRISVVHSYLDLGRGKGRRRSHAAERDVCARIRRSP